MNHYIREHSEILWFPVKDSRLTTTRATAAYARKIL